MSSLRRRFSRQSFGFGVVCREYECNIVLDPIKWSCVFFANIDVSIQEALN